MIEEMYAEKYLKKKGYFKKRYNLKQHARYVIGRNYLKRIYLKNGMKEMKEVNKILNGSYPNYYKLIDEGRRNPDEIDKDKTKVKQHDVSSK